MKNIIFTSGVSIAVILTVGAIFLANQSTTPTALSSKILLHSTEQSSGWTGTLVSYSGPDSGLALADSMYATKESILKIQTGALQKISFTSGMALMAFENQFVPTQTTTPKITIDHKSKGFYYLDVRSETTRVYSLTAILRISIRDSVNKEVTSLTLLPSQYFILDDSIDIENMREVDIFRISQLQTLAIALPKSPESYSKVFDTQDQKAKDLFNKALAERNKSRAALSKFVWALKEEDGSAISFLERYGAFFINDQKKWALYRWILGKRLQDLLKISQKSCGDICKKESTTIALKVTEIKEIREKLLALSQENKTTIDALITDYVLLVSLGFDGKNQGSFSAAQKALVTLSKEIYSIAPNQFTYIPFSELYTRYIFGDLSEIGIAEDFQKNLGVLIDSKSLPEEEFSGFVFFLKGYLSSAATISDSQINLFRQFIQIARDYIPTIKDAQKRSATLSLFFYSFGTIANHLTELTAKEYFTRDTLSDTELKTQYLSGGSPIVQPGFIKSFSDLILVFDDFDVLFKAEFQETLDINQSSWEILDSRTTAIKGFESIRELYAIFTKYGEYRTNISLWESAKNATGLQIEKKPLSLRTLIEYMSTFSWVDPSSIQIINNIELDSFYRLSANIYGRDFIFKLTPSGNLIEQVIINEGGVENRNYERISVSIDDRAKELGEKMTSASSSEDRARFDIKNFFKYAFTEATPIESNKPSPSGELAFELTPQMKLFVQSELIEKDFLLVKDTLTIPLSRVDARIENGLYDIRLRGIESTIPDRDRTFVLKIDSEYLFSKEIHAFKGIEFTVKNEQGTVILGWSTIQILPLQIPTQEFARRWGELAPYLVKISSQITTKSNVILDLDARTITINWESTSL
jgi:hypothetical protein